MQDIVIYAAASETLGLVRDYSNMNKSSAPVLTLGSSVCLRIRLFADINTATPYPIAKFEGITDWRWSMDSDFDRRTACKLVADADGISVHTVTDTVNGETMDFTEFVIRISNMNTEELAEWIGNEKEKTGLTGELVGCDNSGNVAFVLQIEDFSVRNIIFGLMDPTAVDEGIVTRSIAERMIQTAVSSSAATKQDKLNPSNGGTGISVSNAGVISVSGIPQSAVTGLSASLAGKQDTLTAGYRTAIVSGSTVEQMRYFAIEPSITAPANQTTAVVLSAGKAYEIHAVASNAKVVLNREEPVGGTRTFGLEGHAEIYLANTGYVQTGSNVVLANALEPDAVNNCTVRFHDGLAIISVEDHVAGYIVTVNAASGAGSLAYGLSTATNEYISVDASLNGQTLDLAGATTYAGEKHVVGNGYEQTVISGGINCTSKTTFSNLSMQNVAVNGGTMTLGDVFIPSGATVSVSGGGLAVEKVSGNGGTIDLGATNTRVYFNTVASFASCSITGTRAQAVYVTGGELHMSDCTISAIDDNTNVGGALFIAAQSAEMYGKSVPASVVGCHIVGNRTYYGCGGLIVGVRDNVTVSDCLISGNSVYGTKTFADMEIQDGATVVVIGSTIGELGLTNSSTVKFSGYNSVGLVGSRGTSASYVTLTSCAVLDLTGNANAAPIAPGGGITFESGGAAVLVNGGTEATSSSYSMDNVTLHAGAKLTNAATVDLGETHVEVPNGATASISGCTVTGGGGSGSHYGGVIDTYGGAFMAVNGGRLELTSCTVTGNTTATGRGGAIAQNGIVVLNGCVVSGNTAQVANDIYNTAPDGLFISGGKIGSVIMDYNGHTVLEGTVTIDAITGFNAATGRNGSVTISSGADITLTSSIDPYGGITIPAGADVHIGDNDYNAFGGITASSVNSSGYIGGATVTVPSGATCTYTYWSGGQSTTTSATGPATVVVPGDMSYCGN